MNDELKVLIVDDDKTNRRVLKEIISGMARVLLAKNGAQAIEKSIDLSPDLIVLDVVMPDIDGFSVIETLRNRRETEHIPIIFITGSRSEEVETKGLRLGAVDFITKPLHSGVVQARVYTQLQNVFQRRLLDSLAHIDSLTTIPNRRQFEQVLNKEWQNSQRNRSAYSIAMLDVDYFKNYNDYYGHQAGDSVLKNVALAIKNQLVRPRDFIARVGGEEFAVILPETDRNGAVKILQQIINAVKSLEIPHFASKCDAVITISAGLYSCEYAGKEDARHALDLADRALFKAKESGRNQLCID